MLKMGVCGGVSVEAEGRRIPDSLLAGRQGRLLLAYLVCERHRSVPREELAELLWPERLPSSWPASLSVVVSKLRRMLSEAGLDGAAALPSAFGSYRLLLPDGTWVDWEAADDAVERAERAVADGDPEAAVADGREAAEIAGRGFLNDDCPWVDAQRERLRDLQVRALQVCARAYSLAGQNGRAVITARDALALDELRESSFRLLMQALAAAGERGEALRVWERCRVTLADELGVDPAAETEAIYLSILGEEPSVSREPVTPPPSVTTTLPSGLITFFLTDIVDSSGLWERNPAAMAIALERHDRLVAETVGIHGGTVLKAKLEGDATVSVFPRASEAALAAMELRDALAAEPWPEGATIQLRMALHAGEAIERGGDYFGPALNRAARLRAMAGAGQILVSQVVAEVVRDHLPDGTALASLGERQLRGLDRGEHVFQLGTPEMSGSEEGQSAPVERPPIPMGLVSRGPFVGREPELDRLALEWATATAGTARAVLIAGEPGVGKSRLAAEWARRAYGEGALVLFGRCDEEFGAPYQPFAEAVRALLPTLGPARLRSIRGVEQLARLAPEVAEQLPGGATPGLADPDTERSLLFDGLARLFAVVGAEIPVVVVIDDLHWAAKPTLLLLRHLLRASEATRLLIVATYRSTDLSRAHPLAGVLSDLHRDGSADRLALGGLAAEDVSAYLRAAGHEDTRLDDALSTVTSGNPFFLIEVLRHLEETGGTWDPTTLPQGVREAVDRRLSRLSESANEALLVGAVAGSRFSLELIEQVLGRDLVEAIDEARRAGLVVEETGNRFRFYHALVRQSLLAECVSVKRIRLHQRIAAALEADPSSGGDANVADLARHYFECAFAGGAAKAVEYSRRAGELAMVRLAFEEAADLYAQALQAAEIDGSGCTDSDQAELLLVRCEALLAAGDPGAAGVVDQLTQAGRRSPRLSGWATCFAGELGMLIHPDRLETTVAEVAAAADAFARIGDTEGEAKAHTVAASCLARLGRVADCEAALDRALVAARLAGNPRRVNAVLGFAPLAALWGPSPVPQASGRCLDVVRVLRITTGSEAVEAAALRCQAVLEAIRGRFDAARRMLGSARRSLESLGHTHGLLETDLFSGMVEIVAGQPADAEKLLRRAYDGFSARGVSADAAQAAALVARALLAQNRIDEAIALSAESERFAGVDLKAAMAWRAVRAEALAQQGQIPEALELARSAVALVEPTDALLDRAEAHLSLSLVLRAVGDQSGAEIEAVRAIDAYEKKGATALAIAAQHIARSRRRASVKPASPAVSQRRVRANEAYRQAETIKGLFESGDIDGWSAGFSADFVEADHISHVTTDRDTFMSELRTYATEPVTIELELLAALGERHCLVRYTSRYESAALVARSNRTGVSEFSRLHLHAIDASGRTRRVERFKPDDLHLALARLIELHADDELPPERRPTRYSVAELFRNPGGMWSDDFVAVDHRPVGSPAIEGADSVERAWDAWRVLSPDVRLRLLEVLAFRESVVLLKFAIEGHTHEGGWFELPVLLVNQFGGDGLMHRSDVYLPEQLQDALRRFDQLVQPSFESYLSNNATRYMERVFEAEFARDWDTVASMTHEDVLLDDRRSIVGLRVEGREAFLDYVRSAFESGLTHFLSVPIATRGDRLHLSQTTAGGPLTEVLSLAINELADDGRVLYSAAFDPSHLGAAFAQLDARYLMGEGAPAAGTLRPWLDFTTAFNRQDMASCEDLLSPDLTVTDHRQEPTVSGGAADLFFASLRASSERIRVLAVDSVESDAALFLCESNCELLVVCRTDESKIARLDIFPVDQRTQALALLSSPTAASRLSRQRRVRPNAATAGRERSIRLFAAGDLSSAEGDYADDFVDVDHISHFTTNRATFIRALLSYAVRAGSHIDFYPLASLGERHALLRETFRYEGIPMADSANRTGVAEFDVLQVACVDTAGLTKRLERFRPADLHLAVARLIELHADDELGPERRDGRYLVASQFRDQSLRVHRALWSADVVMVDHRPASLWTLRGRDPIGNAAADLRNLSADLQWRFTDIVALTENLALVEVLGEGHNDEGGPVEFRVIAITEYGDDGRVRRSELYRPDQVDEAFRRFEQLIGEADPVVLPPPTTSRRRVHPNVATDRGGIELLDAGDFARLASQFSDDFVDVDHVSKMTTGRDELVRMFRIYAAAERGTTERETLASLGERHAVHRTTTQMEGASIVESANRTGVVDVVLIIVTRTDEAGITTRLERFKPDDLHLALARVIELHAEDELPLDRENERQRIAEWFRNQRSGWTEHAMVVDHRSNAAKTFATLTADAQMDVTDVLAFGERMALVEVEDKSIQSQTLVLIQFGHDGEVDRSEWYRTDQIDDAFYRLDELSFASGPGEFPPPNASALARRRETDALLRGDLDGYLACFTPDVVYHDRKFRLEGLGAAAIEENARWLLTMGDASEIDSHLLATRGDRLSLYQSRWQGNFTGLGPVEADLIELTETDEDGLICRFSLYDADSSDAAYAELDARYAAGEGAPFAAALSLLAGCVASYNERDWGRFQSFLAADVELVDHRTLGWGQLDRDHTVAIFQSLVDLAPDNRSRIRVLHRVTEQGAVFRYQATGTDTASGGEFTRDAIEVMVFEGGLIQRLEFFSIDAVDDALRCFEQRQSR